MCKKCWCIAQHTVTKVMKNFFNVLIFWTEKDFHHPRTPNVLKSRGSLLTPIIASKHQGQVRHVCAQHNNLKRHWRLVNFQKKECFLWTWFFSSQICKCMTSGGGFHKINKCSFLTYNAEQSIIKISKYEIFSKKNYTPHGCHGNPKRTQEYNFYLLKDIIECRRQKFNVYCRYIIIFWQRFNNVLQCGFQMKSATMATGCP